MIRKLLITFIFLSFITQTPGESGLLSRLTLCDLFGFLAIIVYFISYKEISFSKLTFRALFLCILFLIGGFFGFDFSQTLTEIVILAFLIITFQTMVNSFSTPRQWKILIRVIAITLIACVVVGFWDLYGPQIGIPSIFPKRTAGEMKSGFRNAGQAGAYALIFLTILLPIRLSKVKLLFTRSEVNLLNISITAGIIFLFLTAKIAGYIGFAAGYLFYCILKRKFIPFLVIGGIGILLFLFLPSLQVISPSLYARMESKIQTRIVERYKWINKEDNNIDDGEDFFMNNWDDALNSFVEKPLSGSGLGAFANSKYGTHEVHSTYLKMVGEGGILGIIGYVIFMSSVIAIFRFSSKSFSASINPYRDYLVNALPFFLGCLVSWVYIYHLRKREFWIMLAVFAIAHVLALQFENERRKAASVLNNIHDERPEDQLV
jgi:O-antigen ligase